MPKQSKNHAASAASQSSTDVTATNSSLRLRGSRNMFASGFLERRDLEQYFWTRQTVEGLQRAVEDFFAFDEEESNEKACCCLCVPSLAEVSANKHFACCPHKQSG